MKMVLSCLKTIVGFFLLFIVVQAQISIGFIIFTFSVCGPPRFS